MPKSSLPQRQCVVKHLLSDTLVCGIPQEFFNSLTLADVFVDELLFKLVLEKDNSMPVLKKLVQSLHAYEQRSFLKSMLRSISKILEASVDQPWNLSVLETTSSDIAGSTALLHEFLTNNEILLDDLVELLTKLESSPLIRPDTLQRVALASIANDEGSRSRMKSQLQMLTVLIRSNVVCHGKEYGTIWRPNVH